MAQIASFDDAQYPGSATVEELSPPEDLSMPGTFIAVPFADQLTPPPPVPDAGLFVWQRSIVDSAGNTLNDARVEVRHQETLAFADIFEDREGDTQKQNPFLVDSEGFARFYAQAGLYRVMASRAGLERIFENVLLGVRLEDLPDLSSLVTPIVAALLEPTLDELEDTVAALPEFVRFRILGSGTGQGLPTGWSSERLGTGSYRVTHTIGTTNYDPKLQVWDPSSDRVYSAMMTDKGINSFNYVVRSIHDEASASDAQVDIEITVG